VCASDINLIAIITDEIVETSLPIFSRNDVQGIAEFIISRFVGRKPSEVL
jgi:hypothetical protein